MRVDPPNVSKLKHKWMGGEGGGGRVPQQGCRVGHTGGKMGGEGKNWIQQMEKHGKHASRKREMIVAILKMGEADKTLGEEDL